MAASPNDCIFTVPRATARLIAYLQCGRARGDIIHFKNAIDCFEDERGIEGAKTELFHLPGGSSGARKGPKKKF